MYKLNANKTKQTIKSRLTAMTNDVILLTLNHWLQCEYSSDGPNAIYFTLF